VVCAGEYTPQQISAIILRHLFEMAKSHIGATEISKAVISVPAYFSEEQRQATIEAGKLAGLTVVRLIQCGFSLFSPPPAFLETSPLLVAGAFDGCTLSLSPGSASRSA
jgi:hypothetical protein